MLPKEWGGAGRLLATQKPIKKPGWWKGKFALFQMPATGGGDQRPTPSVPPPTSKGVRAFIDRAGGTGLLAETAQSSLTVIFKLVIRGLTSCFILTKMIILAVSGAVNLQFQGPFAPIYLQPVLRMQLISRVQSGCQVVNFSTWCFGISKTAHRMWLRILSIALEKELIVLDYA